MRSFIEQADMTTIANLLKTEITRLARKEVRAETKPLKGASARHRSEIAELKRQLAALQKEIKRLQKPGTRASSRATDAGDDSEQGGTQLRFSATRLQAQRARLGLSRKEMARLVGVSELSIYNWESGRARPRDAQLKAIAAVRGLGKREVAARLAA